MSRALESGWAEMDGVELGDPRRNRRAVHVSTSISENPGQSLPKTFGSDIELEGTYRLLGNESVEPQALLRPHVLRTVERAVGSKILVVVHDTTQFKFGGEYFREGLGLLPNGHQGFLAHASLVAGLDGDERDVLGVVNLETIFRDEPKGGRRSGFAISKADDSEGLRWGRGIEAAEKLLGEGRAIHVCDREADAYFLQAQLQAHGASYVIRSQYDRRSAGTNDEATSLWDAARSEKTIRLSRSIQLQARHSGELGGRSKTGKPALKGASYHRTPAGKRAHPTRTERQAELRVTAGTHVLKKPHVEGRACASEIATNVVRVFEVETPPGCTPVEWLLLTNLPIATTEDIERIVDAYRARWLIEDFFKALKTGCGFEKLQLEGRRSLENALALYVSVAWRLLRLRSMARATRPLPGSVLLTLVQLKLLRRLVPKHDLGPEPTARQALLAVAALGGHIKNNGEPGWIVLGRGFDELLRAERYLTLLAPDL